MFDHVRPSVLRERRSMLLGALLGTVCGWGVVAVVWGGVLTAPDLSARVVAVEPTDERLHSRYSSCARVDLVLQVEDGAFDVLPACAGAWQVGDERTVRRSGPYEPVREKPPPSVLAALVVLSGTGSGLFTSSGYAAVLRARKRAQTSSPSR